MVREIKFRGKTDNGNWLFGEIISLNKHKYIAPADGDWFDFIEWVPENIFHAPDSDKYEVDPNTIVQFTGLHDKNGKEIYEGDIVLWERKKVHIEGRPLQDFSDVCKIYYDDQLHAFRYWYKMTCGSASGLLIFNDDRAEASYIEVIGNIYDNPELLKED